MGGPKCPLSEDAPCYLFLLAYVLFGCTNEELYTGAAVEFAMSDADGLSQVIYSGENIGSADYNLPILLCDKEQPGAILFLRAGGGQELITIEMCIPTDEMSIVNEMEACTWEGEGVSFFSISLGGENLIGSERRSIEELDRHGLFINIGDEDGYPDDDVGMSLRFDDDACDALISSNDGVDGELDIEAMQMECGGAVIGLASGYINWEFSLEY